MPPEQKLHRVTWDDPLNYSVQIARQTNAGESKTDRQAQVEVTEKDSDFHFTRAMNVWNVGKVMYDLATLSRKWDYGRIATHFGDQYQPYGQNATGNFDRQPFSNTHNAKNTDHPEATVDKPKVQKKRLVRTYSKELTALIQACMRPNVTDRTNAHAFVDRTHKSLEKCGEQDGNNVPELSYRMNDINDMLSGSEGFPPYNGGTEGSVKEDDDIKILLRANLDPDWDELRPRGDKWTESAAEWEKKKPRVPKQNFEVIDGKIILGRVSKQTLNTSIQPRKDKPQKGKPKFDKPLVPPKTQQRGGASNEGEVEDPQDPPVVTQPPAQAIAPQPTPPRTRKEWEALRVPDLKGECNARNIPITGLRLKKHFVDKLVDNEAIHKPETRLK